MSLRLQHADAVSRPICTPSVAVSRAGQDTMTFGMLYGRAMDKIKVEYHTFTGGMWLAGWLFTLGFSHLAFWQGVLALVIWPYYLGDTLSIVPH